MTDIDSIVHLLRSLGKPATANEIASLLKVERGSVNSVLYRGLGSHFLKSQDYRPKWSLLRVGSTSPERISVPDFDGNQFHIDQDGGDWSAEIQLIAESRNDPPFRVEMLGHRKARVLVNTTLLPSRGSKEASIETSVFSTAAAALAFQILTSSDALRITDFPFLMGKILLNFQAQSYRNRPTDPNT